MSAYWLLAPCVITFVIGSWLSYTDELRNSKMYVPWIVLLGAVCSGLFAWGAKLLDDKSKIYVFSLYYDAWMMVCYYLLPIIAFKAKISPPVLLGASLIMFGFVLIKVYGD